MLKQVCPVVCFQYISKLPFQKISMRILNLIRRILQFAAFTPFECRNKSTVNSVHIALMFLIGIGTTISTLTLTTLAENFFEFVDTVYQQGMFLAVLCSYTALMWQRAEIISLVDDLEKIVNNRVRISPAVLQIYLKINGSIEKLTKYIITAEAIATVSFFFPWLLLCLWIIYSKNQSNDGLFVLLPLV